MGIAKKLLTICLDNSLQEKKTISLSKEINETKSLLKAICCTAGLDLRFAAFVAIIFGVTAVLTEVINTYFLLLSPTSMYANLENFLYGFVSNFLVEPLLYLLIWFFIIRNLHKRSEPGFQTTLMDISIGNFLKNSLKIYIILMLGIFVLILPTFAATLLLEFISKDMGDVVASTILFGIITVAFVWCTLIILYAAFICEIQIALFGSHGILNLSKQVLKQSSKRFLRVLLLSVLQFLPLILILMPEGSELIMPTSNELTISRLSFVAIQGSFLGTIVLYWSYLDHKTFLITEKQ